ncbi:hypothetical protein D3C80_909560 [compost metagenome]
MKKERVAINETTTESVPIRPETDLPKLFPKKTLIKNPKKGARTKTKAILVFISIYPFKFFKLSIVIIPVFLNIETKIAKPTATSAAATAIEKNTKTCPCASW